MPIPEPELTILYNKAVDSPRRANLESAQSAFPEVVVMSLVKIIVITIVIILSILLFGRFLF